MGYRYTPDLNVLIQSRLLFYMLQNVHLHGCEVQRLEIYVALGGESDLAVPPWASVESSSPQLSPMATNLSRVKYHSGSVGGGSCLAHTFAILHRLFCGSFPPGVHRC